MKQKPDNVASVLGQVSGPPATVGKRPGGPALHPTPPTSLMTSGSSSSQNKKHCKLLPSYEKPFVF